MKKITPSVRYKQYVFLSPGASDRSGHRHGKTSQPERPHVLRLCAAECPRWRPPPPSVAARRLPQGPRTGGPGGEPCLAAWTAAAAGGGGGRVRPASLHRAALPPRRSMSRRRWRRAGAVRMRRRLLRGPLRRPTQPLPAQSLWGWRTLHQWKGSG